MTDLILLLAALLCGLAVATFLHLAWRFFSGVPGPRDRSHMDPLPGFIRLLWPLVNVIVHTVSELVPTAYVVALQKQFDSAGLRHTLIPVELVALQVLGALAGAAFVLLAALAGVWEQLGFGLPVVALLFLLAAWLGWTYPRSWVARRRKAYVRATLRSLPAYLDMITMCCEAGLNLNGAFQQAINKGKDSPLKIELERVLREMRTGVSRIEALRRMANRMDNPIVTSLVSSLIQAEIMGASLAGTLRSIAEQRRTERFQAAEKLAIEAPTKMIFPLVAFVFPVTFLIIGFPIAMKMKEALSG